MNSAPWVAAILGASILLQLGAAVLALRLIRVSKARAAWLFIAAAVSLMAARRVVPFSALVLRPGTFHADPWAESIALAISILMVAGIYSIRPLLEDLRRAPEVLREGRRVVDRVLETSPNLVYIYDLVERRNVFANQELTEFLGYTPHHVRTMGSALFATILHPDDAALVAAHHARLASALESEVKVVEYRMKRPSGEWRWLRSRDVPFARDEKGGVSQILGFAEDITERRRAEEEFRESEERYRETAQRLELATASGRLGVWDWDIRNNRMVWDDRMFELYGTTRDAFPACIDAWLNGLHPEDKERALAESRAAVDGVKGYDTTFRVLRPDGTVRHIKADGLVVRDQDGVAVRMLGLNRDVTESRLAEEERARLQEQLLHSQKLESVGRLAGGVAHDFNNMLGVILGNTEIAMVALDPELPIHASLAEIRKAAERSATLTRQLLAFARKQIVAPRVLDLNQAVEEALKMLKRLIGENVELAWLPGADVRPVKVDASQLDQILTNLCINARDAIAGVGRITIKTGIASFDDASCAANPGSVPGDYVLLSVTDDGCGMDDETRAQVFDPFFTTKESGIGTGLGLATVYGAVKQNGGFISVRSAPGEGASFRIYLPAHAGSPERARAAGPVEPHRGHGTVLLVEDEPAIIRMAAKMLSMMGYTVLSAGTPDEAVRLALENADRIDLLVTDVVMPGMNGRDLARKLQTASPRLRSLFMSGYTADAIASHGVLDEGVNFIQKPFSMTELAAKVRSVLGG